MTFLKTSAVCLAFALLVPLAAWGATGSAKQAWRALVGYSRAMGVILAVALVLFVLQLIASSVS